jgi:hypothetical protein
VSSDRLARWSHRPLGSSSWASWNVGKSLEGQSRCSRRASQTVTERIEWWNTTFGRPEWVFSITCFCIKIWSLFRWLEGKW